jgi:hypothetical protein
MGGSRDMLRLANVRQAAAATLRLQYSTVNGSSWNNTVASATEAVSLAATATTA